MGADGVILIQASDAVDLSGDFSIPTAASVKCAETGPGVRPDLPMKMGFPAKKMAFETLAGIISARITHDRVKIRMTDPSLALLDQHLEIQGRQVTFSIINTGVPHVVIPVDDVDTADVVPLGRLIRRHPAFQPEGTNVNFISPRTPGTYAIRTYERGVEDETLACGTGSVAGALIMAMTAGAVSPVNIITRSNCVLTIYFKTENNGFQDVFLEGDARIIYRGELGPDAGLT